MLGYTDQEMELLTIGRPNMNTDQKKVDVVEQEVKDSLSKHARNVHTLHNISITPHRASELDQNLTIELDIMKIVECWARPEREEVQYLTRNLIA
jgi:hypothetical protein